MSDHSENRPADLRAEFRLRQEAPRVTRLSRKVLVGVGGVVGLAICAALIWALDSSRRERDEPQELFTTENRQTAEGLQTLPKDYAGIPQLGPALPGDLGRPIRRAQEHGVPVAPPAIQTPQADPDEQRRLAEIEAARLAKLFADIDAQEQPQRPSASSSGENVRASELILDPAPSTSEQDRQLAFVNAEPDRRIVSPDRLSEPISPYIIQAGSIISAALITGIRSDLPGQVTAQVTEHVYDTPTGSHLLIPQGSRLVGQYDSQIAFGQSRVLLVWTRLIMPDGRSIVLERLQGTDPQGHSGLEDKVDYHWGQLFRAAALSTLLGIGTELGSNDESEIAAAIRESTQNTVSDLGDQVVRRQLDVQPTLTIRPGFPVRVIVNRDLVLAPSGAARDPS
ncbi:TrbI/VirB10 family protein [Chelativorans sp.]|uniref:TrbI/VirB10 family protein n=1 Tax=Chelativorans sp. TaxID=2203393 RepID=UPI0028117852|nr:TrbI/VirB10 family protein [Chelativorans sp.]